MKNKQTIGLFGFGVVGEGLYRVLEQNPIETVKIKRIVVKNKSKRRNYPEELFCYKPETIFDDPEINLIVELIDHADEAYQIVKTALQSGKSVVSGNKKMLAQHLPELIDIQKKTGAALLYDASSCGSIPVIRNLEEYYDNDLLQSVTGILNGSSNYVLSRLFSDKLTYQEALQQAQQLGFAESNPALDMDGFDALYKLILITTHSLGVIVPPEEVFRYGISHIGKQDIAYAREKGLKIKLVAQTRKVSASEISLWVMPHFVSEDNYIYNVEDEFNGVIIDGKYYDKQFMFGKGAGAYPTSSAILSDITARGHNYRYEYKKLHNHHHLKAIRDVEVLIYLRFNSMVDFSHFEFESIREKYMSPDYNYVIGRISLQKLFQLRSLLPRLDVFVAAMPELQ